MKIISIICLLFLSPCAYAVSPDGQHATREELAILSASYIPEGAAFPEKWTGRVTLSTGVFPVMTDLVEMDLTLEPARPRYILYYSLWTGMVDGGVYKFPNGYAFNIVTIDKGNPVVYTINLLVPEPGKMRINIYDLKGNLVYDGMKEAVLLRCAPLK